MPETCENWLGLVNRFVWYVRQTREIYQALPSSYSVDFKAPEELWNTLNKAVPIIWNKGTGKHMKWPVSISLILDTAVWQLWT